MKRKFPACLIAIAMLLSVIPGCPVPAAVAADYHFKNTIASSNGRVYAIQNNGELWYWGKGTFNDSAGDQSPLRASRTKLMDDVIGVYGDWWNGFAVKSDHSLWSISDERTPVKMMDDVQEAANTYTQWIVLKTNGTVWTGPLLGNTPKPKQILSLSGVKQVSAGIESFYALKEDGALWGWGQSDDLLLNGNAETWAFNPYSDGSQSVVSAQFTPVKLMDNVLKIDGRNHLTVIKKDHTLWDWGSNQAGELGDGTVLSRVVPQKVLDHVADVTAKGAFTIALKSDGTLVGFGSNGVGELGIGDFDNDPHPTPIELMNHIALSEGEAAATAGVGAEPQKGSTATDLAQLEQVEPIKLPKPPFY